MRSKEQNLQGNYLDSLFPIQNAAMKRAKLEAKNFGVEGISVSAHEMRIIQWAIKACGIRKMVEIGTLTGFSGLGLLESLPQEGALWTFEKDESRAKQAKVIFEEALRGDASGSKKQVYVKCGDARNELETIIDEGPFDGIFIDGNKSAYCDYLAWAERNLRKGGLILADNVFLSGAVYDQVTDKSKDKSNNSGGRPRFNSKQISVMRAFNARLCDSSLFDSCIVPSVEGLLIAIKLF